MKAEFSRVDFVTALTEAECRARVEHESARMAPDWQRVFLREDGRFIIERQVEVPPLVRLRNEKTVEVRFSGRFEAVEGGTHVSGGIDEETHEHYRLENWGLVVVSVVTSIIVAVPLLLGERVIFLAAMVLVTMMLGKLFWRWRTIKWYPVDLVIWVRKTLHVPVEPEARRGPPDA